MSISGLFLTFTEYYTHIKFINMVITKWRIKRFASLVTYYAFNMEGNVFRRIYWGIRNGSFYFTAPKGSFGE